MATETQYYVTKDGYYLDSSANPVTNGKIGATYFSTVTLANEFIEASGSLGEYAVHLYLEKTENL
jgi:hypothetical protein